jgi:hypothetical protein
MTRRTWFGIFWIVLSIFWIDETAERVHAMRLAGQAVSVWRYGQVIFWVVLLLFWIRYTWKNWAWRSSNGRGLAG